MTVATHDDARDTSRPVTRRAVARWDLLRVMLVASVLTTVWRLQDLVPALAPFRLPAVGLVALALLLVISPREQHRAAAISRSMVMRGVYLLLLLAAVSVPTSLYFGLSARFLVLNLLPAVLLAVAAAAALHDLADARQVAALQVGGAMLYALVILVRFDVGADGRLGDLVYYDANDIAMLMVCTLPLALFFVAQATSLRQRLLAVGALALFLAVIVKSGSRGAFIGLLAVALYLFLRSTTVPWHQRLAALAVVAGLFVATTGAQYWTNVRTILTPTADYNWIGNTEGGRMAVWERGITYMTDRPLSGVGLNAFPIAEGTISPLAQRQMFGGSLKWSAAHSSYVQIGAELGVFALVVFVLTLLGALVVAGRLARDARRRRAAGVSALARALAAGMIGYMIAGAFLSQAYAPYLFLTLGTIVGLDVSTRRGWRADAAAGPARR